MAEPTPEQVAALDAYRTGENLVLEAGAGTGKTTTLKLMGESDSRRGVYLAYNRAIADEAGGKFPRNVICKTAHAFAFREVGVNYKHRISGRRVTARETAERLSIGKGFGLPNGNYIKPTTLARLAMDTVKRFCYSADTEIRSKHVPAIDGAEDATVELRARIVPYAQRAWADLQKLDGSLRFEHDHYLKLWALGDPVFNCDALFLDEAQDANPVIAGIVERQTHAQRILVGDRAQQIYAWRGAVDAMTTFEGRRLVLSQSFRFGPQIAEEANKWLELLDAPLRLKGFDMIDSRLEELEIPDAILCRTNAEAIAQAVMLGEDGFKYALVGGTDSIKRFAEASIDLKAGKGTWHPDLVAFKNWAQVQEYVKEDEGGTDLKVFVKLIDEYGPARVIEIAEAAVAELAADVVLSTAHKAKGREWPTVLIAPDFEEPKRTKPDGSDNEIPKAEMNLAYVAVTRAQQVLDRDGLDWVDGWLKAGASC